MHVETSGQGPALVLVHGWAMHGGIFAPLTRALSRHYTVHLVDLPGHGRSTERDGGFDPRECAARLVARVPPALWLGWSLGGLVAIEAALRHPLAVRALVPIASNPRFVLGPDWPHGVAHAVFASFADGLRSDWRRTLERFLALETMGSERAKDELRELKSHLFERGEPALPMLEAGLDVLDRHDLRDEIAHLHMPSLWIAGRRDRLVPASAMRWAATQAPTGRFLELPSGHAPFLAHPDEIVAAVRELDASASGARRS